MVAGKSKGNGITPADKEANWHLIQAAEETVKFHAENPAKSLDI